MRRARPFPSPYLTVIGLSRCWLVIAAQGDVWLVIGNGIGMWRDSGVGFGRPGGDDPRRL